VQLRQLDSKAQAARTVLDDFLKRAQETSQMQGVQTSEARTISAASAPLQPTWPKPALLLPVSAFLGLIAGCGIALALGPVRKPEDDPRSPREEVPQATQPNEPKRSAHLPCLVHCQPISASTACRGLPAVRRIQASRR
jgi:hypothetical protein